MRPMARSPASCAAQDRVALVVHAGAAGLVLPPTPGSQPQLILDAIDRPEAGGSTAGGAGAWATHGPATAAKAKKALPRER